MNIGEKIIGGILFIMLAIGIYGIVSLAVFQKTISQTYKDLPCVAQGKVTIGGDCIGEGYYYLNGYPLKENALIYCRNGDQIRVASLRGNICEYSLYKGWNFGTFGDFYYITPK